jgi:hypothetical protein
MTNARLNSRFGTMFVLIALFAGTVMTRFVSDNRPTQSTNTEQRVSATICDADVEKVAIGVDVDPRHMTFVQNIA